MSREYRCASGSPLENGSGENYAYHPDGSLSGSICDPTAEPETRLA